MKFTMAFLITMTLGIFMPSQGYSSSDERTRTAPPVARIQKAEVYYLVYIVDKKGHMVLVRQDNARVRPGGPVSR